MNKWNRQYFSVDEVPLKFLDIRGYRAREEIMHDLPRCRLFTMIEWQRIRQGRLKKRLHEAKQKKNAYRKKLLRAYDELSTLVTALDYIVSMECCTYGQEEAMRIVDKYLEGGTR